MPSHVLYEIPMAAGPVRMLMSAVCLVFLLAIFGSWLPRAIGWLRTRLRSSSAQRAVAVALISIPVLIGLGPLGVLVGLIRNPMTYVSEEGVSKQNMFSDRLMSLPWAEIAHIDCRLGRAGSPRSFSVVAIDGRRLGFGNTRAGDDFDAIHLLFEDRLGPVVMRGCPSAHRAKPPTLPRVIINPQSDRSS